MSKKISPKTLTALYPDSKFAGIKRTLVRVDYNVQKSHAETNLAIDAYDKTWNTKLKLMNLIGKEVSGYKDAKAGGFEGGILKYFTTSPEVQKSYIMRGITGEKFNIPKDTKDSGDKATTVPENVADVLMGDEKDEGSSKFSFKKLFTKVATHLKKSDAHAKASWGRTIKDGEYVPIAEPDRPTVPQPTPDRPAVPVDPSLESDFEEWNNSEVPSSSKSAEVELPDTGYPLGQSEIGASQRASDLKMTLGEYTDWSKTGEKPADWDSRPDWWVEGFGEKEAREMRKSLKGNNGIDNLPTLDEIIERKTAIQDTLNNGNVPTVKQEELNNQMNNIDNILKDMDGINEGLDFEDDFYNINYELPDTTRRGY